MKIIAAFSPLAFAVAHASTHENGLLFIQTQNNGSDSRYHAELADVGGDILNIISDHDLAIVTDMSFAEANAMLSAIAAEYNEGSCLSFAAMRSEERTSELQSLMRNSYSVFCLKKKNNSYKLQK